MASVSPEFKKKLESNPNAVVSVIVRVQKESSAYVQQVQARNLTVRHAYTLIPALALRGPASAVIALAQEGWVVSIEEDRVVHTMK